MKTKHKKKTHKTGHHNFSFNIYMEKHFTIFFLRLKQFSYMKSVTNLNVDVLIPEDDRLTHPILAPIEGIKKKLPTISLMGKIS